MATKHVVLMIEQKVLSKDKMVAGIIALRLTEQVMLT